MKEIGQMHVTAAPSTPLDPPMTGIFVIRENVPRGRSRISLRNPGQTP